MKGPSSGRGACRGLTIRQFYALIWKDFVVHKRHYIWTMLEITIPVLVCAMAILSNSHQGKPRLENERTFDADDYERLYGDLNPSRHRLLLAPNSTFTRALVDQIDDGAVTIELCNTEADLIEQIKKEIPVSLDQVKRLLPDENQNITIGGVVIRSDAAMSPGALSSNNPDKLNSLTRKANNRTTTATSGRRTQDSYFEVISKLDGQKMKIPVNLDMSIRAKDFRLGPEPFPKKYSLGPFLHSDHYQATFFMASQIMMSRAYINLVASYLSNTSVRPADVVIPTNDDIIGQKMPYPKYVAHKRLKETTLGTFVAGSQKQKPFVLTMDYCITVGFLVTAIFLAKRIVDEKKSRVRDMLRLVGISDWTYYGSHMTNTMIIMLIQCAMITLLFTGHSDAPAQNIDSSLMFTILVIYCLASIMFVLALSTIFNSSTKAIIFTSLLWLGLPEVIDRIFKMNAGVIESNGFLALDEQYHLLFCLLPNFGLRLMNRLLTECDIYGEFYDKKQLYGEYRAIWPNLTSILPLYKTITLAHIMGAMLFSIPLYVCFIYLMEMANSASGQGGLASLAASEGDNKAKSSGLVRLVKALMKLILSIVKAPFTLVHQVLLGKAYKSPSAGGDCQQGRAQANLNQSAPNVVFGAQQAKQTANGGHLNRAYSRGFDETDLLAAKKQQVELGIMDGKRHQLELDCSTLTAPAGGQCQAPLADPNDGNDPKYFEAAPGLLRKGVSIRNLCKTYFTSSSTLRRIDAVRDVSLDMYYSQILGKLFWAINTGLVC